MSFIEGVGDEVTAFAVVLVVLILAATITFLLHITPLSERQVSQTTLNTTLNQNHDGEQQAPEEQPAEDNERNNQNHRNIHTMDPDPPTTSVTNTEEVQNSANETSAESKNDNVSSNDPMTIPIYPNISDCDSISGHITEESDVENEERPPEDPEAIRVRLKYLDDTERSVTSHPSVRIGEFKRTHFAEDIANNKVVRLIFSGQLLRDNASLQAYGIANNCVVHVQVLQAQAQQNPTSISQNSDLDLSHLLWPLLSVILGICWILYFKYPEFFNLMSLGMLFLFTGSFIYFYSQVQL